MNESRIRPAVSGDVLAIRAVIDAAYDKYIARIGKKPAPMLVDYEALVASGVVWVLSEAGTVAGILVLDDQPDHLLLNSVAVAPAHQGRGQGRRLIDFAEAEAVRRGYAEIRLYTNVKLTENVAIYTRLGYEETGRGEEDGYHRVFMRKRLAGL